VGHECDNLGEADLNNQQLTCPIYCCGGTPGATLCCPFTTTVTNSRTSKEKTFNFKVVTLPVNKIHKDLNIIKFSYCITMKDFSLFCSLFNDTVSNSGYIVSDDR
jgi:hypothetical protein